MSAPLLTPVLPASALADYTDGETGPPFLTHLNSGQDGAEARIAAAFAQVELHGALLGDGLISGGAITAGVGASVSVAPFHAVIGGVHVITTVPTVIALAVGTNTLFLSGAGGGTANLTGTPPATGSTNGVWKALGTAAWNGTAVSAITATMAARAKGRLAGSATLSFGAVGANAKADLTIPVVGAAVGDVVSLGVPHASVPAGGTFFAWVSAADVVTVRFANNTAGSLTPASGSFRVVVETF